MAIGLSTYSFFWQWHETAEHPASLTDLVVKTAGWGVDLLQICDYPLVESYSDEQLDALLATGDAYDVRFELGTRGLGTEHLTRYLRLAQHLRAPLVRTMIKAEEADDAVDLLRAVIAGYEQAGVTLALETYEQVPTRRLLDIVETIDSPRLGVCLDPGNCVAALETPRSTIDLVAHRVVNVHVKDFRFTRQGGWVGFTFAGAPLGEGLLDYDHLVAAARIHERGLSQIIEHWLVWQGDSVTTCRLEDEWTQHNLAWLRRHEPPTSEHDPRPDRQPTPA